MTCLAPPGYYCSLLDGSVLLCQANRYCSGGAYPPRVCPDGTWSAVGAATIDGCQENMDTVFAATVAIILGFLFVFLGFWMCCAPLVSVPAVYPPPVPFTPGEAWPLIDPWRQPYATVAPPMYC